MSSHQENKVVAFESKKEAADFITEQWIAISEEAIEKRGRFCAALSGGETPIPLYKKLVGLRNKINWEKTHIFLTDERFVPLNSSDSNGRMIRKTLLDKVKIPKGNVHYVPIEEDLSLSAQRYEEDILSFFALSPGEFPQFDLIMLGVGADGHTASLFPEDPALEETSHLVVAVERPELKQGRITLTLPVINDASRVIFFVSGKNKADILKELFEDRNDSLPAALIHPILNQPLFVLDREAAEKI